MLNRVNGILIGKDIARTGTLLAPDVSITIVNTDVAEGEILVLSKDFKTLDATATFSASETIYIVEGTLEIRLYTDPATGLDVEMKKLIVSSPINGLKVKSYLKNNAVAKTEKSVTFGAIGDIIVAGTEYVLRIVYKDIIEHPGQFTETYRYITKTGDDSTSIFDGLRQRIINYKGKLSIKGGARVSPDALGTATLTITGKKIPECTSFVTNIDELTQVDFEAFLNYVDNDYQWTEADSVKTYIESVRGLGSWEVIRDIEKHAQSYRGVENRIWFPIQKPDMRTVRGVEYNTFAIEHGELYTSADNQYVKETPLTTLIAINNKSIDGGTTANQGALVQTTLDSWMGSLPNPKIDATALNFNVV